MWTNIHTTMVFYYIATGLSNYFKNVMQQVFANFYRI